MAAQPDSITLPVEPVISSPAKASAPRFAKVPVRPSADVTMENMVLARLLGMAQRYQREGNLRAAMDLYWDLAETQHDTNEGAEARRILMDLAGRYEQQGAVRMARSIYERVLADVEQ